MDFVLTCNIKLGTAPTDEECQQRYNDGETELEDPGRAGRKRRQTEDTVYTQTTGPLNVFLNDT